MRKYQLPDFLDQLDQKTYERWLHRRAAAHVHRDKNRGNKFATNEKYKVAIHKAVCDSGDKDAYTNDKLDWSLLSRYDNEQSKKHGRNYKKQFAMLPSVDHVGDGKGPADFKICSWRTNDSKNDLSYEEFLELCKKVISAANKANPVDAIKPRG
jgi:hypothetical protein